MALKLISTILHKNAIRLYMISTSLVEEYYDIVADFHDFARKGDDKAHSFDEVVLKKTMT